MSYDEYAIKVENLSKIYEIYEKPHDRLKQFIYPKMQRMLGLATRDYYKKFSALKELSFQVKRGDAVGIVGRNGSGKSTLLQLICGTLAATTGEVTITGRVAALLELGAGFNPEFTGRENVYMNATILGLNQKEIDGKYKEITNFADIGDFIDQPVKNYSSGMYVRLAFAVMVHVDADVLIVDEALAVGDAFFTQKCMIRIKELMQRGVTLLFVSHDANAVKALCSEALLLESGNLISQGEVNKVIETYYGNHVRDQMREKSNAPVSRNGSSTGEFFINAEAFRRRASFQRVNNGKADFLNVRLLTRDGNEKQEVEYGEEMVLNMLFRVNAAVKKINLAYHIRDKNGFDLVYSDTIIDPCPISDISEGDQYLLAWQFRMHLREGDYTISAMISIPLDLDIGQVEVCDFVPIAVQFRLSRGTNPPIYGAVHWENEVSCRPVI